MEQGVSLCFPSIENATVPNVHVILASQKSALIITHYTSSCDGREVQGFVGVCAKWLGRRPARSPPLSDSESGWGDGMDALLSFFLGSLGRRRRRKQVHCHCYGSASVGLPSHDDIQQPGHMQFNRLTFAVPSLSFIHFRPLSHSLSVFPS